METLNTDSGQLKELFKQALIEAMEEKYDEQFRVVFEAIKQLLEENEKPKRQIGF